MAPKRFIALDVFRGIAIATMILVNTPGSWSHVYAPLQHADWNGCTPTDLIFPFFLFIVGVSISLALSGKKERNEPKKELYKKIIRRTLLLFGLGLFLSGFPFFDFTFRDLKSKCHNGFLFFTLCLQIWINIDFPQNI